MRGCKHLDFKENYIDCEIVGIGNDRFCWERKNVPYEGAPVLVQFCKLRGRLNSPTACLGECNKMCSDYEEVEIKEV